MKIITVTVNPAIDIHVTCGSFDKGDYNLAKKSERIAAGKGVNLSRALASYGASSICYIAVGSESREEFSRELSSYNIEPIYTECQGACRENINIHTKDGETVIATEGIPFTSAMAEDMREKLGGVISKGDLVVFSGSISRGSDKSAILRALFRLKELGAELVLDTRSLTLEEIIPLQPYAIKPNSSEAELLTGISVTTDCTHSGCRNLRYGCQERYPDARWRRLCPRIF